MEEETVVVLFSGGEWPLHLSKDGYAFRADAGSLTIEPGPKATTHSRT